MPNLYHVLPYLFPTLSYSTPTLPLRYPTPTRPLSYPTSTRTLSLGLTLSLANPYPTSYSTLPRAQALLRGRAWVAQLWVKSVGAVRLRALPFSLVQQGGRPCGVSRCGPAAAVVGRGC